MNGGWLGKLIRTFDQYLGAWVGLILASTILMGWVEKMFVWRLLDPEKEMYVTVPMFPTPDWWTNPLGIIAILVGTCLAKLGVGYWTNSKYNSGIGDPPTTASGENTASKPPNK
jgi:hypothetical protein